MPVVQAKCPNCGGFLAVDNTKDAAVCQFCNTPFIVEKAINNYNITINGPVNVEQAKISVEGAPSVTSLMICAHGFVLSKDYEKAIEYYNRILDIDPLNNEAKEGIANITVPKQNNLIVERKKSFFADAFKLYIILDSKEIGFLKVGEIKSFKIPVGNHILVFGKHAWFKSTETPSNETIFKIPSSLQYASFAVKEKSQELDIQGGVFDY